MPQNFFVTGMPKSGKTTLLMRVVEALRNRGLKVGGFTSPEEKHHGTRTAFYVVDIATGKQALLASVDGDGPKVSKYHVDVKSFESVAVPALDRSGGYDVIVIDEIGAMELESKIFRELVDGLLESPIPVIASLHRDYVDKYGSYGEVMTLTSDNHEQVRFALMGRVKEAIGPKQKRSSWVKKELPVKKVVGKRKGAKKAGTKKKTEAKNILVKKGLLGRLKGLFR
ncbi:MAG: nucleoside-triphosphatase [Candidatus ainarchaeum sp.]|nr:nucleoside-triphosphatase [Candidatus ainarchaeum sp.]